MVHFLEIPENIDNYGNVVNLMGYGFRQLTKER